MPAIVECVANVSEGRQAAILSSLSAAITAVPGVRLLHQDVGWGAHRTVFTFAGLAKAVLEAAFRLFCAAQQAIDMQQHRGTHPRMGAVDVCPFVPVQGCDLAFCADLARQLGQRVGEELGIPVYLYEAAATASHRRNLAAVRKGEYEGLANKIQQPQWQPDFGPATFHPRFGAAIIGARPFLIAWNIDLATQEVAIAQQLAASLRESGRWELRSEEKIHVPGLFPGLKAIGWYIEEYGHCQVSTNVVDPERVNLWAVHQACQDLATAAGTAVTGSELIGLIPSRYLLAAADAALEEQAAYAQAIERLGLAHRAPFLVEERVLEWLLR